MKGIGNGRQDVRLLILDPREIFENGTMKCA
jgi:hypothetical protein